jgi:predicted DNA-binding protein
MERIMTTISFTIEDEIKARFEALAERLGFDQAQLLRDALLEKLEELEDYQAVTERMSRPYRTLSNEQVWKDLDLED